MGVRYLKCILINIYYNVFVVDVHIFFHPILFSLQRKVQEIAEIILIL